MSLTLVQWEDSTVTPKLDAIMYDDGSYGIIKGCTITHQGTNLLKIASGFIKIAGRLIEVAEETITCEVSASGTVNGQLWIRLNLGAVTPVSFMSEAAAVLTPLTQNEDCNFENGIYELQLATYNIDESVITNLVETAPELEKLRTALDNIDLSANKVTYDNTHSGMTATKVQGAIDEINDNLTASNQTAGVTDVPFRFGCTDDGKFGYIINQGGADSVIPFSGSLEKLGIKSGYMAKLYSSYSFSVEQIPNSLTPASNENAFYIFNFDEKYSLMNMSNGYPEISIVKKDGTVVSIRSGNNDISDAVFGVMFNYNHSTTFTFTAK